MFAQLRTILFPAVAPGNRLPPQRSVIIIFFIPFNSVSPVLHLLQTDTPDGDDRESTPLIRGLESYSDRRRKFLGRFKVNE